VVFRVVLVNLFGSMQVLHDMADSAQVMRIHSGEGLLDGLHSGCFCLCCVICALKLLCDWLHLMFICTNLLCLGITLGYVHIVMFCASSGITVICLCCGILCNCL
jgi:hypothetical protein